jgi:hypothetical protein
VCLRKAANCAHTALVHFEHANVLVYPLAFMYSYVVLCAFRVSWHTSLPPTGDTILRNNFSTQTHSIPNTRFIALGVGNEWHLLYKMTRHICVTRIDATSPTVGWLISSIYWVYGCLCEKMTVKTVHVTKQQHN